MSKPKNQIIILKKTYIEKLFDNINGGDCVDSADIAHGLCVDMKKRLVANAKTMNRLQIRLEKLQMHIDPRTEKELSATEQLIAKAEGRKS